VDGGIVIGLLLAVLAVWAFLIVVLWLVRPRDVRLAELVRVVPDLVRLVRSLLTDRNAPLGVRLALVGLLAWLVNPIDVIPDFVPVLGPLDDVIVAVLVLRYVRRRIGSEELGRRWPGTPYGFRLLTRILGG
jgi:uncharacterized membrane protein YkvA (DUF1232 family)